MEGALVTAREDKTVMIATTIRSSIKVKLS